jgi:cell division control protein 24
MKKWAMQVDTQRRVWKDQARISNNSAAAKPSDTQFNYMRDQVLENPYREEEDEDDGEDIDTVVPGYTQDGYATALSLNNRREC